ncbi:non-heme iron oxygenase ferredoxin subunit [Pseudomonas sp. R5(2019)]|uniref:non-heme iron oxygenase ferredoxin subunit n=1 Tax=Pseudomonas sp. R5(2019) TaxID=2697566 RepID=UPI00141362CE|nr:non-heme iron oxygenase ferredoxin subunit [Pseudomonas sp. R5(2019)]NBA94845.1 Rieske 2Fe-2S domain-containing protein [Pseudomonas sp. R5(2019)]
MTASQALIFPEQTKSGQWIAVGTVAELFDQGDCVGVQVNGRKVGLFKVDDQLFAVDDICTHGNALLSDGDLEGYEIECPLHAGAFDLRNGKALCSPLVKNTRCHSVKVEGDGVFVQLASGEA